MESSPAEPKGVWKRFGNQVYLCGTLGAEFDRWQRSRSVVSAADGYAAQMEGLKQVERLMDALEAEARQALTAGETLLPRKSPGYGAMPLELSRQIIDRLEAGKRLGVSLTESNLLVPSKTVTAICEIK